MNKKRGEETITEKRREKERGFNKKDRRILSCSIICRIRQIRRRVLLV